MPRPGRRDGTQLGLYVSDDTAAKLKTLSAKTEKAQSHLLREALELLFDKYASVVDSKPAKGKPRRQ